MKVLNFVDEKLNGIPMYKLVLLVLMSYTILGLVFSLLGILGYDLLSLLASLVTIIFVGFLTNFLFAKLWKLPVNTESVLITNLILFLILAPVDSVTALWQVTLVTFLAIASKYILVWRKTHLFNPAAFGVFMSYVFGFGISFWWIGSMYLLPFVCLGGLLFIRKTRKEEICYVAILASLLTLALISFVNQTNFLDSFLNLYISGPLVFFYSVMLTEPYTMPGTKGYQIIYMSFIGIFSSAQLLGLPIETSLLLGNLISFVLLHRKRVVLKLKEKLEVGKGIEEYIFSSDMKIHFTAGQYLEWLIPHKDEDFRGQRRFFTMSSSPNMDLAFATKFPPENMSSYKKALQNLKIGDTIYANQLSGDFIMPTDTTKPLIFVAGGIGVTPFISMIRDMLDKGEKRNIFLIYMTKTPQDMAYGELLERAKNELGLRMINECDMLCNDILMSYGLDYKNSICYISGPNKMVDMVKELLILNGAKDIHIDFFPGFA